MERTPHKSTNGLDTGLDQPIWTSDEQHRWDKFAFSGDYSYLNPRQRAYLEDAPNATRERTKVGEQCPQGTSVEMSDSQRMRDFAETGNPSILTPELARRMKLLPEMVREVPGATDEDIACAEEEERRSEEHSQAWLAKYHLDRASLDVLWERKDEHVSYLDRLLEVAGMTISAEYSATQDDDRMAVEEAKKLLFEYAVQEKQGVLGLIGMIRTKEAAGVRDEQIIEEVFDDIHREFITLSNTANLARGQRERGEQLARALNEFSYVAHHTLNQEAVEADDNYLAWSYFHNFCLKQRFAEPATLDNDELWLANQMVTLERLADFDRDTLIPFEIENGRLALFGVDGAVLYVADHDYSEERKPIVEQLRKKIKYSVAGQYFARRVVADVPYALEDEANMFIDVSGQLGRDEHQDLFNDPEFLRDYLYLQRADMRETIEHDFGIQLKSLTIREQAYFLRYLQHTTMQDVQSMRSFTSQYGVNGMRSFLSLAEDEGFGDRIVELGTKLEHNTAQKLFEKYGEIIDASEQAQQYAADVLMKGQSTDTDTKAFVAAIAKNLRHKANNLLRDAYASLTNDMVPELLTKLETIKAENLLWAATFREATRAGVPLEAFRDTSLETLPSSELNKRTADVEAMRTLLIDNYKSYENEEFRNAVLGAFDAHRDDPTTHWYVLKHKDKVVGFNRVDEVYDEKTEELKELYLGSFNVERMQYGGNGIGNAILKASLEQEAKRGIPIRAHCDPKAPITQKYIEWGFVAERMVDYVGVLSFEIVMDKRRTYRSQTLTTSDIEALPQGEADNGLWVERVAEGVPPFTKLTEGYVLTRYLTQGGQVTAVFEKVQEAPPRPARQ